MKEIVLYFGKMDFPYNNASACRVMGVCSALTMAGCKCHVFGHTKNNNFKGVADGVTYSNRKYPKKLFGFLKEFGTAKSIKDILNNFKVDEIKAVFFTSIGHIQLKYLGKWCLKNKVPLIYDCGDINRHSSKHLVYKIISSIEFKLFNRYVKKYSSVMAISTYIKDFFADCRYTFIIPCIADPKSSRFDPLPNKNTNQNMVNIGYFGLPQRKFKKDRLDWCLEAFDKVNNGKMSFYVAGIKKEDVPNEYRNIPNVFFLGKIPNSECISLIKSMDLVVFFRENNEICKAGFPSKVTEAFSCVTPVMTNITSDLGTYLDSTNSITVNGFSKDDCIYMMTKVAKIDKKQIEMMKSNIASNNALVASLWSEKLVKNIEAIQKMLS